MTDKLAPFFNKVICRPLGANTALKGVFAERVDLAAQPCVMPREGFTSLTYIFPEEVVKLPREEEQQEAFGLEHRILAHLHAAGLPVPAVTSVGTDGRFFCQQRVSGVHFFQLNLMEGGMAHNDAARDIAEFLHRMSGAVSAEDAQKIGLKVQTPTVDEMQKALSNKDVSDILGEPNTDLSDALLGYAKNREDQTPQLLHADLNKANMLCDHVTAKITSFIDFGRCHYGDPAVALDTLYFHYAHDFVDQIADHFAQATGAKPLRYVDAVLARLAFELANHARHLEASIDPAAPEPKKTGRWLQDMADDYREALAAAKTAPHQQKFRA